MLRSAREWWIGRQVAVANRARQARDWPRAAKHYRNAAQLAPGRAAIWVQLGHALKERGDLVGAEVAYRQAVAAAGSPDTDASLHLGHLLKRLRRFAEAGACYADVVDRSSPGDPRIVDAHVGLADVFRDQRLWPPAADAYAKALALEPRAAPIWIQLGHALKEAGRAADAEAAYRKALQADPASVEGWIQLGHVLRRLGRRSQAIGAYREALSLDSASSEASHALLAAVGYSPDEMARIAGTPTQDDDGASDRAAIAAFRALRRRLDVIWFGNVEWHFRMQRPQHLAQALASRGVGVVYVSLLFDDGGMPSFRAIGRPHERVLEIRLRFPGGEAADIHRGLSAEAAALAAAALQAALAELGIVSPTVIVQEPWWEAVVRPMPRRRLVYDCVDLLSAFDDVAPARLEAEARMLAAADVTIVTSEVLRHRLADRRPVLIRNGVDVEMFCRPPARRRPDKTVRLGYFGAVREWFAFDWIAHCAGRHADWEFTIVGRPEAAIPDQARRPNIEFLGERPFQELPALLAGFDVAVIPFRANALTEATNPVKLYEYLAGGKPVVATALPETRLAGDLVYLAEDAGTFERGIIEALAADSLALAARRVEWSRQNGWGRRAEQLLNAIEP